MPPRLEDIQGLVLHGYKHMRAAAFLLLSIEDAGRFQAWLRAILKGDLTTAEDVPREERERRHACLGVAFTWHGLKALGLETDALQTFSYEFRQGMARRAHVLGDTGASAPEHWDFGGEAIHVLVLLHGRTEEVLLERLAHQRERLAAGGVRELYCQRAAHLREDEAGQVYFREPFGFRDSLSQPVLQGVMPPSRPGEDYDTPIAAGEILLGHDNEYQEKPPSPSVRGEQDGRGLLAPAAVPGRADLGLDGTYLVLRKLQQDVAGFDAFLEHHQDAAPAALTDATKRKEWLKAKLIGRWPNGAPLLPEQLEAPAVGPHGPSNAFTYARSDPSGLGCPVTSHVRRANPRDSLAPGPEFSRIQSRRHRLLRRGIPYQNGAERGLMFVALNANLGRQFEFVQQSWLHGEKLGRMYDERDPVSSDSERGGMTIPMQPLRRCVTGLQRFVTVKGGGYFFLPGVKCLEFLAHLKASPSASRDGAFRPM